MSGHRTYEPCETDRRLIEETRRSARTLSREEKEEMAKARLPASVDYSPHVTLVYDQVGGGCGGCATLGVVNILKEIECMYSPDLSMKFLSYLYNDSGYLRRDQRIKPGMEQSGCMVENGCCSESTWPTVDVPYPESVPPPNRAFDEAKKYRIKLLSPGSANPGCDTIKDPDLETIKSWLTMGPIVAHSGNHVFAIIGYDDSLGEITLLNSWGDWWGQNGMKKVPYDKFQNPFGADHTFDVKMIQRIENLPSNSVPPYTGRIRIRTNMGRKYLVVKVGVIGQEPAIVWDYREKDGCKYLALDFPLPEYASRFWPPGDTNKWYISVADHTSGPMAGGTAALLEEITLVKRYRQSGNPDWNYDLYQRTIPPPGLQVVYHSTIDVGVPS